MIINPLEFCFLFFKTCSYGGELLSHTKKKKVKWIKVIKICYDRNKNNISSHRLMMMVVKVVVMR